jgi:hypothetical protein
LVRDWLSFWCVQAVPDEIHGALLACTAGTDRGLELMGRASRRRASNRALQETATAAQLDAPRRQPPDGPARRSFACLGDLSDAARRRHEVDVEIDEIVQLLVARGIGWGDIGRALGITRQGARQRYCGR